MPPPARIHKTSKTTLEWILHLAIAEALGDSREGPWYGAWNIVLKDILFKSFCIPPLLTVTYPQFLVSEYWYTRSWRRQNHWGWWQWRRKWDDDDDDNGDERSDEMISSPQHPRILGRHSTPSPQSYLSSFSPQGYQGPTYAPVRYSAPSPESHRGSSSGVYFFLCRVSEPPKELSDCRVRPRTI